MESCTYTQTHTHTHSHKHPLTHPPTHSQQLIQSLGPVSPEREISLPLEVSLEVNFRLYPGTSHITVMTTADDNDSNHGTPDDDTIVTIGQLHAILIVYL